MTRSPDRQAATANALSSMIDKPRSNSSQVVVNGGRDLLESTPQLLEVLTDFIGGKAVASGLISSPDPMNQ